MARTWQEIFSFSVTDLSDGKRQRIPAIHAGIVAQLKASMPWSIVMFMPVKSVEMVLLPERVG
jgi:hypothetical protein